MATPEYQWSTLRSRSGEALEAHDKKVLSAREKLNLDIFSFEDAGHIDPESLPPPDEVGAEIVENLELALGELRKVAASPARGN